MQGDEITVEALSGDALDQTRQGGHSILHTRDLVRVEQGHRGAQRVLAVSTGILRLVNEYVARAGSLCSRGRAACRNRGREALVFFIHSKIFALVFDGDMCFVLLFSYLAKQLSPLPCSARIETTQCARNLNNWCVPLSRLLLPSSLLQLLHHRLSMLRAFTPFVFELLQGDRATRVLPSFRVRSPLLQLGPPSCQAGAMQALVLLIRSFRCVPFYAFVALSTCAEACQLRKPSVRM